MKAHRGRIQVQGDEMEEERSRAWADGAPLPADVGLAHLSALEGEILPREHKIREAAFVLARRWIQAAKERGGVDAPTSKTFRDPQRPKRYDDARVDIEVIAGRAFV